MKKARMNMSQMKQMQKADVKAILVGVLGAFLIVCLYGLGTSDALADVGGGINLWRDGMQLSVGSSQQDGWSYLSANVWTQEENRLDRANVWYNEGEEWPDGSVPFTINFELGGVLDQPLNQQESSWSYNDQTVSLNTGIIYINFDPGNGDPVFTESGAYANVFITGTAVWDNSFHAYYDTWVKQGGETYFSWSGWARGHYLPGDGNLPEPASVALLGLGGLLIRRRR